MRRPRALLAGAILLVTAAVVVWRLHEERARRLILEEPGQVLALLRQAAGEEPLLLPRLSGGYAYGPASQGRDETRSESIRRGPRHRSLARAEAYLQRESRQRGSVEALQARAHLLLLTAAGPSPIDQAVAELEAARLRRPDEAALLSDLSAAHLLRAFTEDEPYSLLLALAAADRAVERDPELLEARFNRALALEALSLRREAREAWQGYLRAAQESAQRQASPQAGPTSETRWVAEAQSRLARLAEPPPSQQWGERRGEVEAAAQAGDEPVVAELIDPYRTAARRWLEEELFAAWATAQHEGDEEAAGPALTLAREVARAYDRLTGDHLYAETVAAIDEALDEALTGAEAGSRFTPGGEAPSLADLVAGHRAYQEGLEALGQEAIDRSIRHFAAAQAALDRAGSPFALRAAFQVGVCEQRKHRYAEAVDRLTALVAVAGERRYPNLQAEALWMVGLTESDQARFGAAAAAYAQALPLVETIGDVDNVAGLNNLLAEALGSLGEAEGAWRHSYIALTMTQQVSKAIRLYQIFTEAAIRAWQQGHSRTAIYFQTEALRNAAKAENPLALAEGYRWLSRARFLEGQREAAKRDLEEAKRFQTTIPDADLQARAAAEIRVTESELLADRNPERAVQELAESITFYRQSGFRFTLASALFARARANLALGEIDVAEQDLTECLHAYEEAREELISPIQRATYFEQAAAAFDEMVALQLRRGRPAQAFGFDERRRSRVLLDLASEVDPEFSRSASNPGLTGSSEPLTSSAIQRQLPAGAALVQFALLEGRLAAWVLDRDELRWVETSTDAVSLNTAVDRFRNDLARGATPEILREDGAKLYDQLIAPLGEDLPATVILIPTGSLHRIPFAALYHRATDRYLVEERTLATVPSASLYTRSLARSRELSRSGPARALIFGNPALGPAKLSDFQQLRGGKEEARRIAALYPDGRGQLCLGPQATEARFLAEAGSYDLVHLASHAWVNLDQPLRSHLLLADDPTQPDDGELFAYEILRQHFPRTRLVILAGCETAGGASLGSEGVASLARPFLAAGVPGVVASLWRVDDQATTALMVRFHQGLNRGQSAAEALEAAQLALLASDDPTLRSPVTWAAFQVIGAADPEL